MSAYVYNSVPLQYVKTTSFELEPWLDPTNTDQMGYKFTCRLRGFLSLSEITFSQESASILAQIKNRLEAVRKPLRYAINPTTIIDIPGGLDDNLGPIPLPCRVTEATSGAFWVETGFVVHLVQCDGYCGTGAGRSPVVSLRWSQTETFDEAWYSRLATKGKLIVRSSLLQSADNFRPLATPPLLPDYRRTSAKYTLSPNGLELEFEFDDKEEDRLPPFPAVKASGVYVVNLEPPGVNRIGTVQLQLEGPKGSGRRNLMFKAISMAYSKLASDNLLAGGTPTTPPIWWGQFDEDLFNNRVSVRMSAKMAPIRGRGATEGFPAGIPDAARAATIPLPVMPSAGVNTDGLQSGKPGLGPPDRSRLAGLLTAAFRDPCACAAAAAPSPPVMARTMLRPQAAGGATEELLEEPLPMMAAPAPLLGGEPALTVSPGAAYNAERNPQIVNPVPLAPVAVINVGPLTTASQSQYVVDTAPYDIYHIETTTGWDTGTVQLPGTGLGSNPGRASFVTAHGGLMTLTTVWSAQRQGRPPQLPTFLTGTSQIVPLKGAVTAQHVEPTADGGEPTYMLAGYYLHGILDPNLFQIVNPVPPWLGQAYQSAAKQGANYWTASPVWLPTANAEPGHNPFFLGGFNEGTPPQDTPAFPDQVPPGANGQAGQQVIQQPNSQSGGGTGFIPQVNP